VCQCFWVCDQQDYPSRSLDSSELAISLACCVWPRAGDWPTGLCSKSSLEMAFWETFGEHNRFNFDPEQHMTSTHQPIDGSTDYGSSESS